MKEIKRRVEGGVKRWQQGIIPIMMELPCNIDCGNTVECVHLSNEKIIWHLAHTSKKKIRDDLIKMDGLQPTHHCGIVSQFCKMLLFLLIAR